MRLIHPIVAKPNTSKSIPSTPYKGSQKQKNTLGSELRA